MRICVYARVFRLAFVIQIIVKDPQRGSVEFL